MLGFLQLAIALEAAAKGLAPRPLIRPKVLEGFVGQPFASAHFTVAAFTVQSANVAVNYENIFTHVFPVQYPACGRLLRAFGNTDFVFAIL